MLAARPKTRQQKPKRPSNAAARARPAKPDADLSKAVRAQSASMLHVRVTDTLKQRAAATLEGIGLTTSEAIRLFLHRVVVEQRLPLDLKVPNAETMEAMLEACALAALPSRFETPQQMFDLLEKTD